MSSKSETPEFLTKKQYMTACMSEGTKQEVCERLWLTTTSYLEQANAAVIENEQLKKEIQILEVKSDKAEAISVEQGAIIEGLEKQKTIKDQEEAFKLSQNIFQKSKLHSLNMPIYYLTSLPLSTLRRLSNTFDALVNKAYNQFDMKRIIADSNKKSQLTAGFYDRNLKRFVTQ